MRVDIQTIRQTPLFARLPDTACAALAAIAIQQHKPAGGTLFLEGDPAPGLYVVLSGRVKLSRTSAHGREQVLHVVTPGEHFNSVPVFDGASCPADAYAMSEVTLLLFPIERLHAVVMQEPELAMALLEECSMYLRRLVRLIDDLALTTIQGRLARLLLTQAEAAEHGEPPMPLTQAEMAARLGTVREMVGRTLKTFEATGLIQLQRGTIVVLDKARLAEQAEL
jgi:CRP-like cAMP-binding protein